MSSIRNEIDYRALIEPTRINSRLYVDPEIFQEELDKIWHKTWVMRGPRQRSA